MYKSIPSPTLALLALVSTNAIASEEMSSLEELLAMDLGEILEVQVATGTTNQVSDAPAVVSVITAEDIKAMGVRTFSEAIERVPGLHVSPAYTRMQNQFTVRGVQSISTPQILILFDGVEISEMSQFASPVAFRYPVNNIERIEIIRGPGSAVYGADAFSGVINVITKKANGVDGTEVGVNYGSFDYRELWLNSNGSFGDVNARLSVTYEKMNNDDERRTQYGILDRRREMANIHLDLNYGNYTWRNWYYKTRQNMGNGAGLVGNNIDQDNTENVKTQLNWNGEISDNVVAEYDLSYSQSDAVSYFELFPAGTWPVGDDGNLFAPPFVPVEFPDGVIGAPVGVTKRFKVNSALVYSGLTNHRIRLGLGGDESGYRDVEERKNFGPGVLDVNNRTDDLIAPEVTSVTDTPFAYSPDYTRQLWFLSLQDEWQISDNLALTSGIRYDHYSDFGSTVNPRLALVWNTTDTLTSKFLYGTAFRAPKVAELVFVNNPATLGNPDLDPEEIETFEIAFDYRPNSEFTGKLNLFTYDADQLILNTTTLVAENVGAQEGYGGEVEIIWQISEKLRVDANASWLEAELPLVDEDKGRVPGLMSFVDLRYQIAQDWLLTTQSYWVADRKRDGGDTRDEIDDYLKTDITVLWQPESRWSARFSIRNVFNDTVLEPSENTPVFALGLGFPNDLPMESRQVFGSFSYNF